MQMRSYSGHGVRKGSKCSLFYHQLLEGGKFVIFYINSSMMYQAVRTVQGKKNVLRRFLTSDTPY